MTFEGVKAFFSRLKNFGLFAKTSQSRWKRHFQEIFAFDTHSTTNLPLLQILKEKFQKKANFRKYLKNLTISVAFYGKLLQLDEKFSKTERSFSFGYFPLAKT